MLTNLSMPVDSPMHLLVRNGGGMGRTDKEKSVTLPVLVSVTLPAVRCSCGLGYFPWSCRTFRSHNTGKDVQHPSETGLLFEEGTSFMPLFPTQLLQRISRL